MGTGRYSTSSASTWHLPCEHSSSTCVCSPHQCSPSASGCQALCKQLWTGTGRVCEHTDLALYNTGRCIEEGQRWGHGEAGRAQRKRHRVGDVLGKETLSGLRPGRRRRSSRLPGEHRKQTGPRLERAARLSSLGHLPAPRKLYSRKSRGNIQVGDTSREVA